MTFSSAVYITEPATAPHPRPAHAVTSAAQAEKCVMEIRTKMLKFNCQTPHPSKCDLEIFYRIFRCIREVTTQIVSFQKKI